MVNVLILDILEVGSSRVHRFQCVDPIILLLVGSGMGMSLKHRVLESTKLNFSVCTYIQHSMSPQTSPITPDALQKDPFTVVFPTVAI